MGISKLMWDALLVDLREVKSSASWSTVTLKKVYERPQPTEITVFPHAMLLPNSGQRGGRQDENEDTFQSDGKLANFSLRVGVSSMTPNDDLLEFLDAITNAVERSEADGGNLIAVSGTRQRVTLVDVDNWEFEETAPSAGNQKAYLNLNIAVSYYHGRGTA